MKTKPPRVIWRVLDTDTGKLIGGTVRSRRAAEEERQHMIKLNEPHLPKTWGLVFKYILVGPKEGTGGG